MPPGATQQEDIPKANVKARKAITLEELRKFDDFLTDYLVDHVYYWAKIRKNRTNYHASRRMHEKNIVDILKNRICQPDGKPDIDTAARELLSLPVARGFLQQFPEPAKKGGFSEHLKRYVSIWLPDCPFEVVATNRYKIVELEAAVVARQKISRGEKIKYLCGRQLTLTKEQDSALKAKTEDFSVVYSGRRKASSIFLGPARFANHDCSANATLVSVGHDAMEVKAVRDIAIGEEITVSYADDYFGLDNCECLCETCEHVPKNGFGKANRSTSPTGSIDAMPRCPSPRGEERWRNSTAARLSGPCETGGESSLQTSQHKGLSERDIYSVESDRPAKKQGESAKSFVKYSMVSYPARATPSSSSVTSSRPASVFDKTPDEGLLEQDSDTATPVVDDPKNDHKRIKKELDENEDNVYSAPRESSATTGIHGRPRYTSVFDFLRQEVLRCQTGSQDMPTPALLSQQVRTDNEQAIQGIEKPRFAVPQKRDRSKARQPNNAHEKREEYDQERCLKRPKGTSLQQTRVAPPETVPKRRRGRPRKLKTEDSQSLKGPSTTMTTKVDGDLEPNPKQPQSAAREHQSVARVPHDWQLTPLLLINSTSQWIRCSTSQMCDERFVQQDTSMGTKAACPKCERNRKLYGFMWPKRQRQSDWDEEERIDDDRAIHPFLHRTNKVETHNKRTLARFKPAAVTSSLGLGEPLGPPGRPKRLTRYTKSYTIKVQ